MTHRRRLFVPFLFFLAGCCAPAGPLVKVPPTPDVQSARSEKAVVWYTPLRRETADRLVAAFRKTHRVEVSIVWGTNLELVTHFLEGLRGNKSEVDVLQLTDPGLFANLKKRKLLRQADVPNRLRVPHWMRDPDGFWVAPFVVTAVLAHRADRLKQGKPPRSWRDLADPRFRKRLLLPDPAEGGPAFYWAAAMVRLHGWGFLEALGRNAAAVVPYREAAERIASGGEAISGGLSGEDAWREGQKGKPVVLGIPAEGVPAIPAATALPKGAAHPNAAALFLNFLLSPAAQRILAGDGFYPALPGAAPPAGRIALDKLRLLQLPWEQTAQGGEDFRKKLSRSLKAGAPASVSALQPSRMRPSLQPGTRSAPGRPPNPVKEVSSSHPCGWFGQVSVEPRLAPSS